MRTDYFLYDERYYTDPDSAAIFEVCDTLTEARENGPDYGGFVIVKTVSKKVGPNKFEFVSDEIVN